MNYRGSWRIFFVIATITALFVLLISLYFSLMFGVKLGFVLRFFLWPGIAFILVNSFGAAFFMKTITISMTFQDKKAFLSKLNVRLAEMDYHPESQTESFLTYKPSFQAGLLSGKISVQIDDNSSTIVGPNTYVKKLQKWLQQQRKKGN